MTLPLTLLMSLAVEVGKPVTIDADAPGRRFVPIVGGEVSGEFIGTVLEGGGDWQTLSPDGTVEISAHYVLNIDGQGFVEIRSDGLRYAPPDIAEALGRGEMVDPALYYFRTAMRFRASAPSLLRLNHVIGLARGRRAPARVHLDVFEVG